MKINEPLMDLLLTPIKKMEFNHRVKHTLGNADIKYLVQILVPTERGLRYIPSIGEQSANHIKEIIAKTGFPIGALEEFKKELWGAKTYEELLTLIETDTRIQKAIIDSHHGDLPPQHHWMYSLFPENLQLYLGENFNKLAYIVLNDPKIQEQVSDLLRNAVLKELGLTESIAA